MGKRRRRRSERERAPGDGGKWSGGATDADAAEKVIFREEEDKKGAIFRGYLKWVWSERA